MSPKTAECDYLVPRKHALHSAIRWIIIEGLPNSQWCEAGLRPCTNLVWDILLPAAFLCPRLIFRTCAKTKVRQVLIREMLFADDAALISHTEAHNSTCPGVHIFDLTISLKKTNVMGPEISEAPAISIDGHTLEVV